MKKYFISRLSTSNYCADEAKPINTLRAQSKDVIEFDKSLDSLINLYTTQPEIDYPDGI